MRDCDFFYNPDRAPLPWCIPSNRDGISPLLSLFLSLRATPHLTRDTFTPFPLLLSPESHSLAQAYPFVPLLPSPPSTLPRPTTRMQWSRGESLASRRPP